MGAEAGRWPWCLSVAGSRPGPRSQIRVGDPCPALFASHRLASSFRPRVGRRENALRMSPGRCSQVLDIECVERGSRCFYPTGTAFFRGLGSVRGGCWQISPRGATCAGTASWERLCPARKWEGEAATDQCGRDTSVWKTRRSQDAVPESVRERRARRKPHRAHASADGAGWPYFRAISLIGSPTAILRHTESPALPQTRRTSDLGGCRDRGTKARPAGMVAVRPSEPRLPPARACRPGFASHRNSHAGPIMSLHGFLPPPPPR